MNTNEELKTRPDFEKLAKQFSLLYWNTDKTTTEAAKEYLAEFWTTHVEPLQASVDRKHAVAVDLMVKNEALQSENQKLRDLLKDAQETLIMASLIDKSNTCDKAVAKINAGLNLDKTNP